MVKIEELTQEERKEKVKLLELEKIALELFPKSEVISWGGDL